MSKNKKKIYSSQEEAEHKQTIETLKETIRDLLSENKQLKAKLAGNNVEKPIKQDKRDKKIGSKEANKEDIKQIEESKELTRNKWKEWREANFGKYREES